MDKMAKALEGALVVLQEFNLGYHTGLTVACGDYGDFRKLPPVVELRGVQYGKTGWDSDKGIAFYRTDVKLAVAVRE